MSMLVVQCNADGDDDFVPEKNELTSDDEYDSDNSSVNFVDEGAKESAIVDGCWMSWYCRKTNKLSIQKNFCHFISQLEINLYHSQANKVDL